MIEYRVAYKTFLDAGFDRFITTEGYRPLTEATAREIADGMNAGGAAEHSRKMGYGDIAVVQTREVGEWH